MADKIVSVNGIGKSFGAITALSDVSLSIERGMVTAIVGDNGSGKSTLIKLLSGNLSPDCGTITVEGKGISLPYHSAGTSNGYPHRLPGAFP